MRAMQQVWAPPAPPSRTPSAWPPGFYLNATREPWSKHWRMYDYVTRELPALLRTLPGLDVDRVRGAPLGARPGGEQLGPELRPGRGALGGAAASGLASGVAAALAEAQAACRDTPFTLTPAQPAAASQS